MSRLAVAVAILLLAAGCGSDSELLGSELYGRSCAGCHGVDGQGSIGPAVGFDSASVSLSDEQLAGVIENGPGSMPAFSRLGDDRVESLVAHLRVLQSGPEQISGAALYGAECAACHGADGEGATAAAVGAGSASVSMGDAELSGIIRDGRGAMAGYGDRLNDLQVAAIVAHLRELQAGAVAP